MLLPSAGFFAVTVLQLTLSILHLQRGAHCPDFDLSGRRPRLTVPVLPLAETPNDRRMEGTH